MPDGPNQAAVVSSQWRAGWNLALQAALVAALCAFVARHYYLKPYSDPLNWLLYARNLAAEWKTSRWPIAYPLYLWTALRLAGPYYVFFANLPLLAVLLLLVGKLSSQIAAQDRPELPAGWVGTIGMALLLMLDPELWVYLTNPYRDPLSHVFLLAAFCLFVSYLPGPRFSRFRMGGAGLCLGLAASVREPAILAVFPLALCGVISWWKDRRIPFWSSAITFAAGVFAGLLPLLIQTYLRSGQVLLPPQAIEEGKVLPGIYVAHFGRVAWRTLNYYYNAGGIVVLALPLLGLATAVRRRQVRVLTLLVPAILLFGLFYMTYVVFVRRYFFTVNLFAAPLAAYGLAGVASGLMERLRRSAWREPAIALLALALAGSAGVRLGRVPRDPAPFRIPYARRLTRDLQAVIPRGSVVLAPRHLCEVLRYFLHADSYPAYGLSSGEVPVDRGMVRGLKNLMETRTGVCLAEVFNAHGRTDGGGDLVRQYAQLEPFATFTNSIYNLGAVCGDPMGRFVLHRLRPWAESAVEHLLAGDTAEEHFLQVDAKVIWHEFTPRTFARLQVSGRALTQRARNGLDYYRLPSGLPIPMRIRLESDQPVPADLAPVLLPLTAPLNFSLKPGAVPSALSILVPGEWRKTWDYFSWYGFTNRAAVELPVSWAGEENFLAEFRLRAAEKGAPAFRLQVRDEESGQTAVRDLPRDGAFYSLCLCLQGVRGQEQRKLWIEKVETTEQGDPVVEIGRVTAYPLFRGRPVEIDLGIQHDAPFIAAGWHDQETYRGTSFRWTTAESLLTVYVPPDAGDQVLRLFYSEEARPAEAPSSDLRLVWNGQPLQYRILPKTEDAVFRTLEGNLPAAWVQNPSNCLTLTCTPWSPKDWGAKDGRSLGVMVDRVILSPAIKVGATPVIEPERP